MPFLSPTDTQHPRPRGLNRVISNSNRNVMYTLLLPPPPPLQAPTSSDKYIFTVKGAEGPKANVYSDCFNTAFKNYDHIFNPFMTTAPFFFNFRS